MPTKRGLIDIEGAALRMRLAVVAIGVAARPSSADADVDKEGQHGSTACGVQAGQLQAT